MYQNFFTFLLLIYKLASAEFDPLSDEFIDYINKQGKWKAGRNFHPDTPISYLQHLLGAQLDDPGFSGLSKIQHDPEFIKSLPKTFDPREKWPNCPSLNEIRDQDSCGSCWAFGAVEAMTDRVCTYSNGSKNFHFSAEDLVTCAGPEIGDCYGGYSYLAWAYWVNQGIVSGGNYGSKEGCRPYSMPPCEHATKGNLPQCVREHGTPDCVKQCQDGYNVPYEQDKRYGKNSFVLQGEDHIKAELFKNGPVAASFAVYADFFTYKGGVYRQISQRYIGSHSVKILGWGEEEGTKYWVVANSWNTHFGLKGFFKILRGTDECGIESAVYAGEPALEGY